VLDGYSGKTQHEVQEGLNVVENWNATNDFICYGSPGRTGYQQP
jgi:TnpA family transposase